MRITGPAAVDVLKVFRERWLDHPDSPALDARKFQLSRAQVEQDFNTMAAAVSNPVTTCTEPSNKSPQSYYKDCQVCIGRTYANLQKFSTPPNTAAYTFINPPGGEETAWQLIAKGIQAAQRFIYIEDQYFVSRRLKAQLISKLREPLFEFLLILTQNSASFEWDANNFKNNEFPYLIPARNDIRAAFKAVNPRMDKWGLYYLKPSNDPDRAKWCGSYVHSKTLIFDDEYAIVGTANADDRGYTFDTEVVASITDDALGRPDRRPFARDLRIKLWHKHLGVPHAQVADRKAGLNLWKNPPPTAMVVDASAPEFSPLMGGVKVLSDDSNVERLWRESLDPDADLLP